MVVFRGHLFSLSLSALLSADQLQAEEPQRIDMYGGEHVSGADLSRFAAAFQPAPAVSISASVPGNACGYTSSTDLEKVRNVLRCQSSDPWQFRTGAKFVVLVTKASSDAKVATVSYLTQRGNLFKTTIVQLEDEKSDRIDLNAVLDDVPSSEGPDVTSPTSAAAAVRPGTEGFIVAAGYEVSGRYFDYNGAKNTETLRHYKKLGISSFYVGGELFPFAWTEVDHLRDIGLRATYTHAVTFDSATQDLIALYDTEARSFTGDLLYRLRLPDAVWFTSAFYIGPTTTYHSMSFTAQDDSELVAPEELPAVEYITVGGVISLRGLAWSRFQIQPNFRLTAIAQAGGVYDISNLDSALAVSTGLRLGVSLGWGFSFSAIGNYTAHLASIDPLSSDSQAKDATDHFIAGATSLSYALAAID